MVTIQHWLFAAGLIAHNPAAKRSAKALLSTHEAVPCATSFHNISGKCQNQIIPYHCTSQLPLIRSRQMPRAAGSGLACIFSHNMKETSRFGSANIDPLGCTDQVQMAKRMLVLGRDVVFCLSGQTWQKGLHVKWRCFVPDYYNLLHLADWNTAQRGLWSGLKGAVCGHRRCRWEIDPVLCGRRGLNPVIVAHMVALVSSEMIAFSTETNSFFSSLTFSLTAQKIQFHWSDVT